MTEKTKVGLIALGIVALCLIAIAWGVLTVVRGIGALI